tara:strand:- start:320 stop:502 length:183 start_codon:yes stop_codon:yes gene_type:complete
MQLISIKYITRLDSKYVPTVTINTPKETPIASAFLSSAYPSADLIRLLQFNGTANSTEGQ